MKKKWRAALILALILLAFAATCYRVVQEGLTHGNTRAYFRLASENIESGEYRQGLRYGLMGMQDALEGGIRWIIGKPHVMKAQSMLYEGNDLYGALDECESARAVISDTYDDEGAIDYLCWRIRAEINPDAWQDPTVPIPTKTSTP